MSRLYVVAYDDGVLKYITDEARFPADGGVPCRIGEVVVFAGESYTVTDIIHDADANTPQAGDIYVIVRSATFNVNLDALRSVKRDVRQSPPLPPPR